MAGLSSQVSLSGSGEFVSRLGRFGLTEEGFKRLNGDDVLMQEWVDDLKRRLNPPVDGAAEKPTTPRIRIVFEIAGRKYEAVSFVKMGESCDGNTMVARTDTENGGGLGEEDANVLWEHRAEWPKELKSHYLVFTKWRYPGGSRGVRDFVWDGGGWDRSWRDLGGRWDGHVLVVRRCT